MRTFKQKLTMLLLFAVATIFTARAGQITVQGTVYSESDSLPIIGATVKGIGTNIVASTNTRGEFTITMQQDGKLQVSYIGYQTKIVEIKSPYLKVYLKEDNRTLSEVVVFGYGTQKRTDVTGAVATVRTDRSTKTNALSGKVSGVQVKRMNQSDLMIRGSKSATPNFNPLYVIDGKVYTGNAASVDPQSIASIKILKDKSATAVYGSRGANGVVVITTKTGNFQAPENLEEYTPIKENSFKLVSKEPLSTFSLDVDAASYSNVRRMINDGHLPDADAVRIEEMVNYFSYDYAQPKGSDPVKMTVDATSCPWMPQNQLVRIGVKAKEIPSENLPASNFVFLLDVSGSMNEADKLPLVKSSIKLLVNNLREKDRVAIVVYAGAAGVALESTQGSYKQKILEAVDNLSAGGSTAGGAGIQLAYQIAEKNFMKDGNNRIILCTDGDFNVGVSSNSDLENLITNKRKSGVFLTVLGYGMGNYKDAKLETLADKGNGNHAYIDNLQEANKVLVNEFGSTMYTVAKDVKIQVEFNPRFVSAYRLIGYENRLLNDEDFNDDTKDAGELGSGHTVTALYEVIPAGIKNPYSDIDPLKYQTAKQRDVALNNSTELMTVKLRYKEPDGDASKKIEVPVMANSAKTANDSDLNFQMAVAMFGQLLRHSGYKGKSTYDDVLALANKGYGEDKNGYRHEFVRLVESVKQLSK